MIVIFVSNFRLFQDDNGVLLLWRNSTLIWWWCRGLKSRWAGHLIQVSNKNSYIFFQLLSAKVFRIALFWPTKYPVAKVFRFSMTWSKEKSHILAIIVAKVFRSSMKRSTRKAIFMQVLWKKFRHILKHFFKVFDFFFFCFEPLI